MIKFGLVNTKHNRLTLKIQKNVLNGKCKKDGDNTCNCNGCFSSSSKVCCSSFSEDNKVIEKRYLILLKFTATTLW